MSNRVRFSGPVFALFTVIALGASSTLKAAPVDFTTYTPENFAPTAGFSEPVWRTSDDGSEAGEIGNSWPTVFYSPDNVLGMKITGRVFPTKTVLIDVTSEEDDIFGFMLGYQPGDTTSSSADYVMIDWKRVAQPFDFADPEDVVTPFQNLTGEGEAFTGLSLSRVTGVPTADELWQKDDLAENPGGGVEFLAPASTLGATGYNFGLDGFHDFEIWYEADRIQIWVDGNLEFDETGTFPDGRFALYENHQSQGATFENFEIEPLNPVAAPGDFDGDGDVDGADFVVWQTNFPTQTGGTLATGDADGDGDIDGADFVIWQTNFPFTPSGSAAAVPEPNAIVLMSLAGALALLGYARQKPAKRRNK